ncbi:hypothetical protein M569_10867 [Genlisea aurea]|uniref:Methyltransferase type 11 domain-containing protein n=1 Tax=Genlisea aurea TaxID=192259 RepID=S8CAP7_9LAMI|nr:hypothetical protein M569_10867 [Genlisea aurea]
MADLFLKQPKEYAEGRPAYPQQLFDFIASKTPSHHLAWDVGTGSGQAARSLADIYSNVVATDTSPNQLEHAEKLPNIAYRCTPPKMSTPELRRDVGSESSFDVVTVAQALHWFDLPTFYEQARYVLKKPDGVVAAWCYTLPEVSPEVDSVLRRYYSEDTEPYWDPARSLVDRKYETVDFPFEAVDGCDHTGPFRFDAEKGMDLEGYLTYLKSWSAYQTAKEKGVCLLGGDVVRRFEKAWNDHGPPQKVATFPVYLRIGKVGSLQNE